MLSFKTCVAIFTYGFRCNLKGAISHCGMAPFVMPFGTFCNATGNVIPIIYI